MRGTEKTALAWGVRPIDRLIRAVAVVVAGVGALVCGGPAAVLAAPEPDVVPRRWQLQLEPGPLRVMEVQDETGRRAPYYYFTYKVTNNTGQDLFFAPSFELYTDDGKLTRSNRGVPREVTTFIRKRLNNRLLEDEVTIQGRDTPLLQGDENARMGLVVWTCENQQVDEVTIFAEGFSGETKAVERPDTGEKVVLRKTYMLRHHVSGDLNTQSDDPLDRTEERWIMR